MLNCATLKCFAEGGPTSSQPRNGSPFLQKTMLDNNVIKIYFESDKKKKNIKAATCSRCLIIELLLAIFHGVQKQKKSKAAAETEKKLLEVGSDSLLLKSC